MTSATESYQPAGESILFDDRVFTGFATVVVVLMVAMLGLFLWLLVRNLRILRRVGAGAAGVSHRPVSVHAPSLAARLQELDDLHRRGVITDAEHSTARHQALTTP